MIVGLGVVGGHLLELLSRMPSLSSIIAADMNEDYGIRKTNNAILGAMHQGFYPRIRFRKTNLHDIDGTAQTIREEEPDVIFNGATLQSWWVIGLLPDDVHRRLLDAGFGPWLPMHLTLTHKLMKAVRKSGVKTNVVSIPYPDAVNPILGKVGLAPTVGAGNFDLIVPRVRKVVSDKLKVPIRSVSLFMVGHHFHQVSLRVNGNMGGAPYYLKILVDNRDITSRFDLDQLLSEVAKLAIPEGAERQSITAASAAKNILAILSDTGELTHAPGPAGLPGGYPIRLSADGPEVVLPEELSLSDAVKINEKAQKFDGIERIRDDGTVVITEKSVNTMREMLGYDCPEFGIEESERRGRELASLYKGFADKYRVEKPIYI